MRGSRWVPYQSFHTGYKQTVMQPDELLRHIRLPRLWPDLHHYYRKVAHAKSAARSQGLLRRNRANTMQAIIDVIRIALGSVAPIPLRCRKTEAVLQGAMLDENAIEKSSRRIVSGNRAHRRHPFRRGTIVSKVSLNVLEEFLRQLRSR